MFFMPIPMQADELGPAVEATDVGHDIRCC